MRSILVSLAIIFAGVVSNASPAVPLDLLSEIQKIHNLKPSFPGPNCWNTAMVSLGLLDHLRFSYPGEFTEKVDRHCLPVEVPQPGDLGAIRRHDGTEVHAFIYVGEDLVFQKLSDGYFYQDLHSYGSWDETWNTYKTNPGCTSTETERCSNQLSYFRCARPQPIPHSGLSPFEAHLDEIEEKLNELLYKEQWRPAHLWPVNSENARTFLRLWNQLGLILTQVRPIAELPLSTEMKWRLDGIELQIQHIQSRAEVLIRRSKSRLRPTAQTAEEFFRSLRQFDSE